MQTVTITIDTDAQTEIAVKGCPGGGCQKLTADIEKALGKTVSDTKTGEFYHAASQQAGVGQ